ncbi:MAG: ATP synthase F0 subunit B [Draconibacterium sp.]|nr:MAG: ATP synthase F0 subunit B [Draconibacterium sp.]
MGLVMPDIGTIFWGLIIIGTVFFILKKFAWKPILEMLSEREESIAKALLEAESARKEMQALKASNEKIIAEAKSEKSKILQEAKELKNKIVAEAKKEAGIVAKKEIEQARTQIQLEKDAAIDTIKKQIATLSVQIAEKVIRKDLDNKTQQETIVSGMIDDLNLN